MYRGMISCVLFSNKLSRWFELQRGVRQGGVLSALFYLVFINDLLIELDNAKCGTMLLDLRISSSVQADDIALMSPTEHTNSGQHLPVIQPDMGFQIFTD